MSDGVIVLAIFTCQPPRPKNIRASPSCSNSSQRRFMTLCCRPTSHRFGVQPTCCNFCWLEHTVDKVHIWFNLSCTENIFSSSCCSLSTHTHKHTVLLLVHTFNKSDMSDLWKQCNCPLRTQFQHRQGGWSGHISPLHVSLQWLQCVWQMRDLQMNLSRGLMVKCNVKVRVFSCPRSHRDALIVTKTQRFYQSSTY